MALRVGELVRVFVDKIIQYCETQNPDELQRLLDPTYSWDTFKIRYPFFKKAAEILPSNPQRYWTEKHECLNTTVRVCSQWFPPHVNQNRKLFEAYLVAKQIATREELLILADEATQEAVNEAKTPKTIRNQRYRGRAIGNAQNQLIRNILSNLGHESFSEQDWEGTKAFFSNRCAYCGAETTLIMDHGIPINRTSLGEHRLGNLIPCCHSCNAQKADRTYIEFLEGQGEKIARIEEYMSQHNYQPLGENPTAQLVLEMAYQEVAVLAKRYITLLNGLCVED